jgi:hypothetical protein
MTTIQIQPLTRRRPWLALFAAVALLAGACRSLPRADPGRELAWPEGWPRREHFVRGDLHLLATSQDDAEEALDLYQTMLEDLETMLEAPPPGGLVYVFGGDDELTRDELERLLEHLVPGELRSEFELDRKGPKPPPGAREETPPETVLAMAALPLDVERVLSLLDWRPESRPRWALTLPTRAATRRALDEQLERQDVGLMVRAAFALMKSRVLRDLRRAGLTRTLVQVACPDLSEDERNAVFRGLTPDQDLDLDPDSEEPE